METSLAEVQRVTAAWRAAPPIHCVASSEMLPVSMTSDTEALYHGGEVFVVGDHPPERVAQLLGHEAIAHHGLRVLHGRNGWPSLMGAIAAGARDGEPTLARCREYVRSAYRTEDGELYLGSLLEADETAARLAEVVFDPELGPFAAPSPNWDRLAALIGRFRRDVLLLDEPATVAQVRGALLEAEALLREGRRLGNPLAWCYPAAVPNPKPMGANPPPRNLKESQDMLVQSKDWSEARSEAWFTVQWVGGLAAIVIAVVAVALWAISRFTP